MTEPRAWRAKNAHIWVSKVHGSEQFEILVNTKTLQPDDRSAHRICLCDYEDEALDVAKALAFCLNSGVIS